LTILENKASGTFTYFKYDKVLPSVCPIWLKQEQWEQQSPRGK